MPRTGQKKGAAPRRNPRRRGAPDPDTVVEEIPFTSPLGETFTILRTNQTDAYDPPPEEEGRAKKGQAKKATKKAVRPRRRG